MPRHSNLSVIVADAWQHCMDTSPDPFRNHAFDHFLGLPAHSYRWLLDEPKVNMRGERIPRIEIVRSNLLRLGPTRLDPARLTRPHRGIANMRLKGHGRRKTDRPAASQD